MISTKFLGGGSLLIVIGVLALGSYLFGFNSSHSVFTVGLFLLGGGVIFTFMGIFGLAGIGLSRDKGVHADDQNAFSVGLFRCMIAISIADNVLDDSEITEITRIYKHLANSDIEEQVIRDAAEGMMEEGVSIENEIKTITGTLDKAHKEKLVIASLYILAADGDMDEGELIMLDDIRLGLGLSLKQVDRIKDDFLAKRSLT